MSEKKKNIRMYTWEDYGISKERYKELKNICMDPRWNQDIMIRVAAEQANKDIKMYIYYSVTENKTYELIEYDRRLGRIPCGRTDFYGYRRKFYSILDKMVQH